MLELLSAMHAVSYAPPGAIRSAIRALRDCIQHNGLDAKDTLCGVQHHFAPGQYIREFSMCAGTVVVGRIHKHAHLNMLLKGSLYVLSPTGGLMYLRAPMILRSEPGEQRVGYALEDTIWATVHNTDCTDVDKIIEELTIEEDDTLVTTYEVIL